MSDTIPVHHRDGDFHYTERGTAIPLKRISWSAIFAGVIISMVIYLLLTILGTAIGATSIDPLKENNPTDGLATGAAIWTAISMLIAVAAGGYTAGRLAQREGMLHGLLMFGVNTLICAWLAVTLVNSAVSGAMNILGGTLQTLGSGISAVAPSVGKMAKDQLQEYNFNLDDLQNEMEKTLRQTGKRQLQPENLANRAQHETNNLEQQAENSAMHPQTTDTDLSNWFNGVIRRNQDTLQAVDKDALKNIVKARTGKSDAEAEQIVNQAEQSYQQARAKYQQLKTNAEQTAREAADKAAAATAKASWFMLIMLIVEALLAGVMGKIGRRTQPREVVVR